MKISRVSELYASSVILAWPTVPTVAKNLLFRVYLPVQMSFFEDFFSESLQSSCSSRSNENLGFSTCTLGQGRHQS